MNKTAINYRRLKHVRSDDRELPDLPETAQPRFGNRVVLSHRRGQKRLSKWVKYVQV